MAAAPAPNRQRRRLLTFAVAGLLLLPALYVAAVGPVQWWDYWHAGDSDWCQSYYRTLRPLYRFAPLARRLHDYTAWWRERPVPRSWQRQRQLEHLSALREELAALLARRLPYESEASQLQTRLRELTPLPASPDQPTQETRQLEFRLRDLHDILDGSSSLLSRHRLGGVTLKEVELQQAEATLRQLDAK